MKKYLIGFLVLLVGIVIAGDSILRYSKDIDQNKIHYVDISVGTNKVGFIANNIPQESWAVLGVSVTSVGSSTNQFFFTRVGKDAIPLGSDSIVTATSETTPFNEFPLVILRYGDKLEWKNIGTGVSTNTYTFVISKDVIPR